MQVRKYVCNSEFGRKAKLQPIFFPAKIHMVLFLLVLVFGFVLLFSRLE